MFIDITKIFVEPKIEVAIYDKNVETPFMVSFDERPILQMTYKELDELVAKGASALQDYETRKEK